MRQRHPILTRVSLLGVVAASLLLLAAMPSIISRKLDSPPVRLHVWRFELAATLDHMEINFVTTGDAAWLRANVTSFAWISLDLSDGIYRYAEPENKGNVFLAFEKTRGSVVQGARVHFFCTTWMIILLMLQPGLWLLRSEQRARRKDWVQGHCGTCGYDLRASGEVCPECGTKRSLSTANSTHRA